MNKIILAPAGGRKTQTIIDQCLSNKNSRKLIITYTTTGQKVISDRIWRKNTSEYKIDILGWYSFLLNHIIYPYIYDKYPNQIAHGLHFVDGVDITRYRKGTKRYFDDDNRVFSNHIGKLAYDIAIASNGAWLDRLERIYDEIYFDEVQDLAGNDLDILQLLFKSKINITAVGDVRQSLYSTSRSDSKHKQFNNLNKIEWFRRMKDLNLCELEERTQTWRCNQDIINFANSALPKKLNFPDTKSLNREKTGHDGVFLISWQNLPEYINKFNPQSLRNNINSKILNGTDAINFGQSKGMTFHRVLIYPTDPIKKFLKNQTHPLKDKSASAFYVAVTRAKHSVTIVVDEPKQYKIQEWNPNYLLLDI